MKLDKKSLLLYLVTDRRWLNGKTLESQIEESLQNGTTFLQLREKDLNYEQFLELAVKIKLISNKYKVPFVINDDIQVAIDCDADGVHIGQKDITVSEAKKLIGNDKILGVSAQTVKQAVEAEQAGADYIGVGTIFTTNTKKDADSISLKLLKEICNAVSIPVVAIGGINEDNILKLQGSNIDGVAVVSAILAQKDIALATTIFKELAKKIIL